MATSRSAPTVRTRGLTSAGTEVDRVAISPARWAGVALVVGSLVTAMAMAMTSTVRPVGPAPGDAAAAVVPVTSPSATGHGLVAATGEPIAGVPTEVPEFVIDAETVTDPTGQVITRQREVSLTVTVPETELRPRQLKLQVLRDGKPGVMVPKPSGEVTTPPVRLSEGPNRLSVRLEGPGGPGPESFALTIVLDTSEPALRIASPKENHLEEGDRVTFRGQSDPGAIVTLDNRTSGRPKVLTVGPTGSFEEVMQLERGENRVRIRAEDAVGNVATVDRTVRRAGAGVTGKIVTAPKSLTVRELPDLVRISTVLVDEDKVPVKGAEVTFTLVVPGLPAETSPVLVTKADGSVSWRTEVGAARVEKGTAQITMVADLPGGDRYETTSEGLAIR